MIKKIRTRRRIRARGSKREFLEEIKTSMGERGYKEKDLLYRCHPGPEDTEEWQKKLREASERHEGDSKHFIVALPQEKTEEALNNGIQTVEVYYIKDLLETDYKHVYQRLPGSGGLITSFSRDPEWKQK